MALTRDFKKTVQARIRKDPAYRKELLREGVECLLAGDLDTGRAILGNPRARNLLDVIAHLQKAEGLRFELSTKR